MNVIVNHTSMQPVYEQIVCQIKEKILPKFNIVNG